MLKGLFHGELESDTDSEESRDDPAVPICTASKKKIDPVAIADKVLQCNEIGKNCSKLKNDLSTPLDEPCSSVPINKRKAENCESSFSSKRSKLSVCSIRDEMTSKEDLELQLSEALSRGEVERADYLNDQLIEKELSIRLKQAEKAKTFQAKRTKQLQEKVKNRRKKLNWTFESKKRWETKSNM